MYFLTPFNFDCILLKEKCTTDIYRCLNNNEIIPSSINKWNTVLATYLSNNNYLRDGFKICFKINCSVVTIINVVTSDECSFCKEDSEKYMYLYW